MEPADTTKEARKISKYGNRKTEINGIVFDSRHEATRWIELSYMERARLITDLRRQVPFVLIPAQKDADGKLIEREVKYIADFTYRQNGQLIVEDTKGMKTKEYIIKRKLMLERHGIRVQEV